MRVQDLLRDKGERIVRVPPGTKLIDAMRLMAAEHVGTVLVIDEDDGLRGLISERDFVRIFTEHGSDAFDFPVCDLIRRHVITCHDDATLHDLMTLMSNNGIRHLPAVRDGKVVGMVSARDVLDAQKYVLMRMVKRHKQAFNLAMHAKERAVQSDHHKTAFLHRVSHELRTPLNAIIGFSSMIQAESWGPVGAPQYADYAAEINAAGEKLLGIIGEILEMSRLEMGAWIARDETIDLDHEVEACLALFREEAEQKSIRLVLEPGPHPPQVIGDRYMIGQMFCHLLSNAVKFTPHGGTVRVGLGETPDGGASFSVGDTGRGIAPDAIAWVTKPFNPSDGALTRNAEGAGLGLALTDAMIALHGGTLEIVSPPGKGTEVTLRFPRERNRADTGSEARKRIA